MYCEGFARISTSNTYFLTFYIRGIHPVCEKNWWKLMKKKLLSTPYTINLFLPKFRKIFTVSHKRSLADYSVWFYRDQSSVDFITKIPGKPSGQHIIAHVSFLGYISLAAQFGSFIKVNSIQTVKKKFTSGYVTHLILMWFAFTSDLVFIFCTMISFKNALH
jgi:hypothetical protein